jgi:hypothetical protein
MILPGANRAVVDEVKVRAYLLSHTHVVGQAKARFFARLGFSAHRWQELQTQLLILAQYSAAEAGVRSPFGQKYLVRGIIRGPNGRTAAVQSVWIIRAGESVPRLVTAIPVASL